MTRIEKDMLGEVKLDKESLTGIHSHRAKHNFSLIGSELNPRLLRAYGLVKLACAETNHTLGYLSDKKAQAILTACAELAEGKLIGEFSLSALQGGAGTATNMYVNELIANRSLELLGEEKGSYDIVSPLEDINLHQSTNDTFPTSLKVATMLACNELEEVLSKLTNTFQEKEKQFSNIVRLGRTQLQDAVAMTLGQQFSAYTEAFSKDRWRIYKCQERLRSVNLGGTAIGTGMGADQKYIFMATDRLRKITNLPIARSENLIQATQNCDEFVEVSGFLKTLATNMFKIASDMRLLSSGPVGGIGEIKLPARADGSSIMPGKVNPIIAEMICQVAIQTISRDSAITLAAMSGQLELNAFLPLIANNLLCMLDELIDSLKKMNDLLVAGIEANPERCAENLHSSTAIITAFVAKLGYTECARIAAIAKKENRTIEDVLLGENLCTKEEYDLLTSPQSLVALGFRKRKKKI